MDAAELRKQLLARGYSPLPLNGKSPAPMLGWQDKIQTNDAEIELWDTMYPQNTNTGVLTRTTPALDIDLLDEAAAVAVEDLACERFGDRGRFLLRIGKAPKRLVPLRTTTPFPKLTLNLIAGNGRKDDKVEVLGDGQQMAVHGMHPDIGEPYRWLGAELWTVPAAELPLVDEAEMRGFLDDAGKLLVAEYGYQIAGGSNRAGADGNGDGGGRDWGDCITGILNGTDLHDNITVLAAKQVAAGIDAGVVVNFIRDLMARAQAPHDARWQERVDDIPRAVASAQRKFTRPPDAPDDDKELEKLARMPRLDYERARKDAAEKLDVRASILDKLVASKRAELGLDGDDGKQGRQFNFPQVEPWPTAVNGSELFNEISSVIRRHVIMPSHAAEAIALWVVHTHLVERFLISPRLALRSVTKQCGKTTTLDILARLVHRPLPTVNVTAAAIFRVVEAHRPCLLVDEADTFLNENEELRGIINSGHRQGGAVLRVEGDQHETRAFATYAPCAIAAIGSLPGTIMDRSIVVDLARRKPDEKIEPFRLDRTAALDEIARRIVRWAKDNAEAVAALDPDMPPGLYNRNADNWRPLFQVAGLAGADWPQRSRAAALAGAPDLDEVSRLELLLGDIRDIFDALPSCNLLDPKAKRISSAEMIEKLCEIEPRPWAEYGKSGKPITQNKLARLLKPLGVAPEQVRFGSDDTRKGYMSSQFAEAFERYLPKKETSNRNAETNAANTGTSSTSQTETSNPDVSVPKSKKSNNDGLCFDVSVEKGEDGYVEPLGLSTREIDAQAERYADDYYQRRDEPDIEARLNAELRYRLLNELGVLPEHLETEFRRVIEAVFRVSDAQTRRAFADIRFDGDDHHGSPGPEEDQCP